MVSGVTKTGSGLGYPKAVLGDNLEEGVECACNNENYKKSSNHFCFCFCFSRFNGWAMENRIHYAACQERSTEYPQSSTNVMLHSFWPCLYICQPLLWASKAGKSDIADYLLCNREMYNIGVNDKNPEDGRVNTKLLLLGKPRKLREHKYPVLPVCRIDLRLQNPQNFSLIIYYMRDW